MTRTQRQRQNISMSRSMVVRAFLLLLSQPLRRATAFTLLVDPVRPRRGTSSLILQAELKPESSSEATATPNIKQPLKLDEETLQSIGSYVTVEAKEIFSCLGLVSKSLFFSNVTATDLVQCCDRLDQLANEAQQLQKEKKDETDLVSLTQTLNLRRRALEFQRYQMLATMLAQDYDAYVATASFLSPSRIPRRDLPNVQDVPYDKDAEAAATTTLVDEKGIPLVADCQLDNMEYKDNPLDVLLLKIFRNLVTQHTGGVTSETPGIQGLLDQGRTYMLQPNQTAEAQHNMVYQTLKSLMTPVLPPFYRIFMSGIVPPVFNNKEWDGKQLGPWFYAPFLTSFVTPVFFQFLVGPSHVNRRQDGALGGLVVEKCKFLQESGCKGLCLHQCKLPAQQFFAEELGLPLTVSPNFVTQECQWSFGQDPLPPAEDPTFPKGCLSGCESRSLLASSGEMAPRADLCNY